MKLKRIFRKVKNAFALHPRPHHDENNSYAKTHVNIDKGTSYDSGYRTNRGQRLHWEIEQFVLKETLKKANIQEPYLDFAGGTGRIASIVSAFCKDLSIIDISESMLNVARATLPDARIHCADFRENNISKANKYGLVSAFRFFANAEPTLRNDAFQYISRNTKSNGLLILNNHRNFWSIPYVLGRVFLLRYPYGMTHNDVITLATANKFRLVECRSFGILPYNEYRTLFPWCVNRWAEHAFVRSWFKKFKVGSNVIYVFKKL